MSFCWQILLLAVFIVNGGLAKIEQQCNENEFQEKIFDPKHTECLEKYLNHTILIEEFNEALVEDNVPGFMKNNCPKLRQSLECFDAYYEELDPCLNSFQRMIAKLVRQLIETFIDYICSHNGVRLTKFVSEDGLDCIVNNMEELKSCGVKMIGDDLANTISLGDSNVPKVNFSSRMFTGNECRLVYNTSHCMINVIGKECSNGSFNFINDLFINLYKQTPCWGVMGILDVQWEHYIFALLLPKRIPTKDRNCTDGRSAFDVSQESLKQGSKCWNSVIDNSFLISDMQQAFETRTLFSFLKKYCPKLHGIAGCVGDYLNSFQQCVNEEDSAILNSTISVIEGIANFVCHRDGERVLLFLKENGFECLMEQKDNIKECVVSTGVTELFNKEDIDFKFNDPNFSPINIINQIWVPQDYSPQECKTLVSLEVCVYKMMRQCKERSPANLISSLVRSVAKKSPCLNVNFSGSRCFYSQPITLAAAFMVTLLYKYLL